MSPFWLVGLCFASAFFYVLASVLLKMGGHLPFLWILLPVLATLAVAARAESLALDGARIGYVVVLIIGFEALVTGAFALVVLRESYGLREATGFVAILAGAALLARS